MTPKNKVGFREIVWYKYRNKYWWPALLRCVLLKQWPKAERQHLSKRDNLRLCIQLMQKHKNDQESSSSSSSSSTTAQPLTVMVAELIPPFKTNPLQRRWFPVEYASKLPSFEGHFIDLWTQHPRETFGSDLWIHAYLASLECARDELERGMKCPDDDDDEASEYEDSDSPSQQATAAATTTTATTMADTPRHSNNSTTNIPLVTQPRDSIRTEECQMRTIRCEEDNNSKGGREKEEDEVDDNHSTTQTTPPGNDIENQDNSNYMDEDEEEEVMAVPSSPIRTTAPFPDVLNKLLFEGWSHRYNAETGQVVYTVPPTNGAGM
jgi:hypothetical protein